MKRLLVIIALILQIQSVFPQSLQCTLSGIVREKSGEAIPFASVVLARDSKIITGCMTDNSGRFQLKAESGEYLFSVKFIGYSKYSQTIELTDSRQDIGTVVLEVSIQSLNEAVVTARQESANVSVERTSINADANISGAKGSALDILRSASSVSISSDKNITVRGKSNILVLLDGIPTTISDLESIPAANVKSIDIITNPDASYDAEGTGGIINIISKRQTASGISGIVGGNYGFNHFANGNFAVAGNTPKFSWRVNGNAKYEDDIVDGSLSRMFVSTDNGINQQIHSAKTTFNCNLGAGVTYRPDKRNIVSLDAKFLLPRFNTKQDFHNTYLTDGSQSSENRYSDVTWNRENLDVSASWKHIMKPDFSEFKFGGNVSKIWGHRPSYYYLEGKPVNKSNSGGSPLISSLQGDFKFKYAPGTLDFGAKMTYRQNDQFSEFFKLINDEWIPEPQFSTDLIHQEYIPALYALFTSEESNKRFYYKVGLRTEYSIVKLHSEKESLDKTKGNLFVAPSLSGEFKITPTQKIALAYSRRIGRPTYPQLNPYMSMIDANTFEQGNINLNPEKSDIVDFSYSAKSGCFSAFADIYLNHTKDYISQVSKLTEDGILLLTYINCTSDLKTGLDLSLKIAPVKWFDATLSANTFFTDTRGDFEDIDINNRGWSNNSNLLLNFLPLKNTNIQLQYFLSSPQYYPQFTTAFNHYMNIGIKQTLCKEALTLSVTATDIFGTDKWEIHSVNSIYTLDNSSSHKSRMVWLGISYNFNSFKQSKTQKQKEEDRSRLNLGM